MSNLGESLTLSQLELEWLPEYIWISLIHDYYGREKGIDTVGRTIKDFSEYDTVNHTTNDVSFHICSNTTI